MTRKLAPWFTLTSFALILVFSISAHAENVDQIACGSAHKNARSQNVFDNTELLDEIMAALSNRDSQRSSRLHALSEQWHRSYATGYYPSDSEMEGGFSDRYGNRLYTLQEFLSGKAPYVSVAMDASDSMEALHSLKNPVDICIPELDEAYRSEMSEKAIDRFGGRIRFRVVDTGAAFRNKGWSKIDICVKNRKASLDSRLNQFMSIGKCP